MFAEMLPAVARRNRGGAAPVVRRRHHAAQRQADDLPDDPVGRAHPGTGRHAPRPALVQAGIPAPARPANPPSPRGPAQGAVSPDEPAGLRGASPAGGTPTARPASLPGQRHGRGLRQTRGRSCST